MNKEFVRVACDVHCEWDGTPPRYRVYVNDELFTERKFTWKQEFLEESMQIDAPPGDYTVRFELLDTKLAVLIPNNLRVEYGPGEIIGKDMVRINHEAS